MLRREVDALMPGWDSLESVTRIYDAAQIAVLILIALLLAGGVLLLVQLRRDAWPEWIDVGRYQVRSLACEVAGGVVLALLMIAALAAYGYGFRKDALKTAAAQPQADQARMADDSRLRQAEETKGRGADQAKAHQAEEETARQADDASVPRPIDVQADRPAPTGQQAEPGELALLQRKLSETEKQVAEEQRKLSEAESQRVDVQRKLSQAENQIAELRRTPSEAAAQVRDLQRKLSETESQLAALHRKEMQKRLSDDEKKRLIEALAPFAGQKVAVAFRLGDEDGKTLAEDFVAVFKAAGWNYGGEAGLSVQRWDRDPVGVEIALNEADARAGRISNGIGALINAVRKLRLSYDNTIYMSREVPAGQAVVKIGRRLPRS
jgi:hypothetical protein